MSCVKAYRQTCLLHQGTDYIQYADMTVAEASDYASLVFKASDPDSDHMFTCFIGDHLSNTKLLQVGFGSGFGIECRPVPNMIPDWVLVDGSSC